MTARFSGSHLLNCNAIFFAFAMLMWCCPTTQVAVKRDRELTAQAPLADGTRPDGHSALVSSIGASIKQTSTVVDRQGDRSVFPRHPSFAVGNEIPTRRGAPMDYRPVDLRQPLAAEQEPSVGGSDRGTDHYRERGSWSNTGMFRADGREQDSVEDQVATLEPRTGERVGEDIPAATGDQRGIAQEAHLAASERRTERPTEGASASSGSLDGPQPTTCDKCQKARNEDLIGEYDPNALVQLRIETIKRQILDKLRMERPPKVNVSSINIPAPLSEGAFIDEFDDDEEQVHDAVRHLGPDAEYDTTEDYYGKTTRVIVPAKQEAPPCPLTSMSSSCFGFDISSVVRSRVAMAELWLYWTGEQSSTRNHTLTISQLSGYGLRIRRTIGSQSVPPGQSAGWLKVDIKHTVRRWRSHSHHDHVVHVTCPTCESNALLPLGRESNHRPFIVIRVTDEERSRRRRNVNCLANTTDCCRQHFRLKFMDLGWDWVISPRGFDANYCRGSCSNFNSPSLTHTSIMHTLRSKVPTVNIPRPCCTPKATGMLSMIYIDEHGKFYTVDLPQMKILSCGCS
ncbi:growth/differentiation factor 8-like [Diadema antillarum]|uniref:growth/differentiation factor 8-like n=1 Tax=Diadema antillarum TaxID=105358 RepID=UPI003A860232